MMWIKDGKITSPANLRAENPNVGIPKGFSDWGQFGASFVYVDPLPDVPFGKEAQKKSPVKTESGWVCGWELVDIPDEDRRAAISAECRRRIYEIADETAQINLAAAAGADLLTPEQFQVWKAGLQWVAAMRAQYKTIFDQGLDPHDDANWPAVPTGVAELGAAF